MSFEPDNPTHEVDMEALLEQILFQLRLLNLRFEDVHETGITEEDVE